MHEPVKVNVENYLDGSQSLPREFTAHLSACERCRQELAEMKAHSALIGSLRADEEFEPRAGFYARVIERIDSQRQSSIANCRKPSAPSSKAAGTPIPRCRSFPNNCAP